MSVRKTCFENDKIYHIYNRGVEKRNIFTEDIDYVRFLHDLFELNNQNKSPNITYHFKALKNSEARPSNLKREPRELLVEIFGFVLMPNHYHLILKQKSDNGVIRFMQKLGTGYAMFFNQKYERVGSLFQGKFKSILVDKDSYLIHLLNYIHFNPLDLNLGGPASEYLRKYRWSSFLDYIGEKNFPSITSRDFMLNYFGETNREERYKKEAEEWLREKDKNISDIRKIVLLEN